MTPRRILLAATLVAAPSLSTAVAAFGSTPPASPDTAELPRSLTYAGTQWTIESAAFDPGAGDAPPTVRLDFSVVSQLETYGISVPMELLAVELPDGALVRATNLDGMSSEYHVDLDPGATASGSAVFEVADTDDVDLSRVSFVIDEPDHTPATLPLAGPVPPQTFPMPVDASGTTGPIAGTCSSDERVELTVNGATETLDLGPQRAADGTAFLTLDLRIAAVAGPLGFACVDGAFLRLAAGNAVLEPISGTDVSESLDVGTTIDTTVAFAVSLDVTTFELRIGANGTTTATITISLPNDPTPAKPNSAPPGQPTSPGRAPA